MRKVIENSSSQLPRKKLHSLFFLCAKTRQIWHFFSRTEKKYSQKCTQEVKTVLNLPTSWNINSCWYSLRNCVDRDSSRKSEYTRLMSSTLTSVPCVQEQNRRLDSVTTQKETDVQGWLLGDHIQWTTQNNQSGKPPPNPWRCFHHCFGTTHHSDIQERPSRTNTCSFFSTSKWERQFSWTKIALEFCMEGWGCHIGNLRGKDWPDLTKNKAALLNGVYVCPETLLPKSRAGGRQELFNVLRLLTFSLPRVLFAVQNHLSLSFFAKLHTSKLIHKVKLSLQQQSICSISESFQRLCCVQNNNISASREARVNF